MKPQEAVEAVKAVCRRDRMSIRTEESYSGAAHRFVRWCSGKSGNNEQRVSQYLSEHAERWSAASENLAITFTATNK